MQGRRLSCPVRVGDVTIGGGAPVVVQEMTSTDTRDAAATVAEILAVEAAGCEVVRVAVPDRAAALALPEIKRAIHIPLVADIHFDYRLALLALDAGVDKLRINPGNIGSQERVEIVARAAQERGIPIRIGVNAGSLSKEILAKYGRPSAEAMVESALEEIAMLEALDFRDIIISLKSSDVPTTIEAYTLLAEKVDYPLHVGVTEAGTSMPAVVRNAIGVGVLLYRGIGDTIRMSYTASGPVERVRTAYTVLESLGLRSRPSLTP